MGVPMNVTNAQNVTTGSKRVHRPGAKNAAGQTTAKCGGVMAHRLFRTDADANCRGCDDAVIAEQNAPSAERIAELHPAAKTTARQILNAMLDSGELSGTAWGLVSQNADDTMAEAARGLIEREPFEYMS